MELYAAYIKEREDIDMIYDNHCFITYKIEDEEAMVHDFYSDQEVRGSGYMLEFCNKFIKTISETGVKKVYGQTDERTNGWEHSDKVLRKYGFRFLGKDPSNENINNYLLKINLGE